MDFFRALSKMKLQALLCFLLLMASVAHCARADGNYRVNVKIVNQTATPLVLFGANWSVSPQGMGDYAVPAHYTGSFVLTYSSIKKGAMSFRYIAGDRSCTFEAGHGTKTSFGWFKAKEEPYQWANAASDGVFGAVCKAQVLSSQPGEGYTVQFSIK